MPIDIWLYVNSCTTLCLIAEIGSNDMDTTTSSRKPGKKRIMVQVWGALAKAIDRDLKQLHLKRDGYLNDLLKEEIEALAEEVDFRNSDEVRARVQGARLPERAKMTLELDEALIPRIDEVLKDRNISRDSFINRILFFLVADSQTLVRLNIKHVARPELSGRPLKDALVALYDPFFYVREANDGRFYTIANFRESSFDVNLFALNTAIRPEDWVAMNKPSENLFGGHGFDISTPVASEETQNAN